MGRARRRWRGCSVSLGARFTIMPGGCRPARRTGRQGVQGDAVRRRDRVLARGANRWRDEPGGAARVVGGRARLCGEPALSAAYWAKRYPAPEMTSLTPTQAAPDQAFRNPAQKVSASLGSICRPAISRLSSVLAATAIIAAAETMRPHRCPSHRTPVRPAGPAPSGHSRAAARDRKAAGQLG